MKLVVGLGNPGRKYAETRHNIGWMVLAELKQRYGKTQPKEKFHGELVEAEVGGEQVLLLAPHTFMNRSGQSVSGGPRLLQALRRRITHRMRRL